MKRTGKCIMALFLGCCAPLLILMGGGVALYQRSKEARVLKGALPGLTCSLDRDCPPGYVCIDGRCLPLQTN